MLLSQYPSGLVTIKLGFWLVRLVLKPVFQS